MKLIYKKKEKRVLRPLIVFLTALVAIALMDVYAAYAANNNPIKITVTQVFFSDNASPAPADGKFTYRLKPLESGNPMPAGSTAEGYIFTVTGNNSVEIGPLTYNQRGVYRYELGLFQEAGTENPGCAHDKRVYTIEAYADGELNVQIIVLNANGAKTDYIVFENSCRVLPSDPNDMPDALVKKTVFGNPTKPGIFTFRLTARNNSYPMPAGSVNGVKNIRITGSGEGSFGKWSYDKAGTYYYAVCEVDTGEPGYAYDSAEYTITDKVKEENGKLVVSRVVTNEANKPVRYLTFINSYKSVGGWTTPTEPAQAKQTETIKPDIPAEPNERNERNEQAEPAETINRAEPTRLPEPTNSANQIEQYNPPAQHTPIIPGDYDFLSDNDKPMIGLYDDEESNPDIERYKPWSDGPKTGDDMNAPLFIALFAAGGVLTVGAILCLIIGGKRRKGRRYT